MSSTQVSTQVPTDWSMVPQGGSKSPQSESGFSVSTVSTVSSGGWESGVTIGSVKTHIGSVKTHSMFTRDDPRDFSEPEPTWQTDGWQVGWR